MSIFSANGAQLGPEDNGSTNDYLSLSQFPNSRTATSFLDNWNEGGGGLSFDLNWYQAWTLVTMRAKAQP